MEQLNSFSKVFILWVWMSFVKETSGIWVDAGGRRQSRGIDGGVPVPNFFTSPLPSVAGLDAHQGQKSTWHCTTFSDVHCLVPRQSYIQPGALTTPLWGGRHACSGTSWSTRSLAKSYLSNVPTISCMPGSRNSLPGTDSPGLPLLGDWRGHSQLKVSENLNSKETSLILFFFLYLAKKSFRWCPPTHSQTHNKIMENAGFSCILTF